jgi:cytochrome P450
LEKKNIIRVRKEIDEILGTRTTITNEDLVKMNYTNCVYKEALRLWPPIPEIGRTLESDMNINGYHVPKGTWVQVYIINNVNFKA